jgi:hypothetical protein
LHTLQSIFSVKPQFQPTFKIGSQSLALLQILEEITFGEYVDLENNLQKWDTYHIAMRLCIPTNYTKIQNTI